MNLAVNQLIKWNVIDSAGKSAGRVERVLHIDENAIDVAAIDVDAKRSISPRISKKQFDQVRHAFFRLIIENQLV